MKQMDDETVKTMYEKILGYWCPKDHGLLVRDPHSDWYTLGVPWTRHLCWRCKTCEFQTWVEGTPLIDWGATPPPFPYPSTDSSSQGLTYNSYGVVYTSEVKKNRVSDVSRKKGKK